MTFYRAILKFYRRFLKPDGFFLFEIGYDEADAIRALAKASGDTCEIFRDLGGNDRVALIRPAAEQTNRDGNPNGDPDAANMANRNGNPNGDPDTANMANPNGDPLRRIGKP